jgi:hypothetical protein
MFSRSHPVPQPPGAAGLASLTAISAREFTDGRR